MKLVCCITENDELYVLRVLGLDSVNVLDLDVVYNVYEIDLV